MSTRISRRVRSGAIWRSASVAMCAALVASSISVPAALAAPVVPSGDQGLNLPAATLNTLPAVVPASTLPLKFVDSTTGGSVVVRTTTPPATPPKTKTEIASKRTERTRTFANPDGTYTAKEIRL